MPGPVFRRGERIELRTVEPVTGPQERDWVESVGEGDATHLLICADGDPVGTISLRPQSGLEDRRTRLLRRPGVVGRSRHATIPNVPCLPHFSPPSP